ncbi:TetR/AcrR family transcriptional regulator [Leptothoe spongobia]|uniref:TetR/AcrR family transcriptional regulator n=1 Tax=Leptothoe spongobia TAU-MAC 1115 TaxID=1967444 RepID=A0A947DH94_9CYAN|nr:TetR/AcrR family transcriptional regulator [Leptothoe spongobia]MBT9316880.1 TetR/AcrR family transcriptional regulator [Leptothoe spongobia TAU-MAC 1115]
MARPREFDPQVALQSAIQVFWEKGYYDTSVDEVVKRSGVAKYGIYNTFGPKRELFKKVLKQYATDRHQDIQTPIRRSVASLPEIHEFFAQVPHQITQSDYPHGCLVCSTGVEVGQRDPDINTFVKDFFADIAKVLKGCLSRAVKKGELTSQEDIDDLANYLVTEFRCALMLARSGHTAQDIQQHLKLALRVLQ